MTVSEHIIDILRQLIGRYEYNCRRVIGTGLYRYAEWEAVFLFDINTSDATIKEVLGNYPHKFTVLKNSVEFNEDPPKKGHWKEISCKVIRHFD